MKISSAHVHTTFCDGKNTAREMIEAGINCGFTSIGISSHAVQDFDKEFCMESFEVENQYINEVRLLASEYKDRIKVWLGIERDTYSISDPKKYDYFLASNHYFFFDNNWTPVNAKKHEIDYLLDKYCNGDIFKLITKYFNEFTDYIVNIKPTIIGHFDLIKRVNDSYTYFDENDDKYLKLAKRAMNKIISVCDLLEVNSSVIERRGINFIYPSITLLKYWFSLGGKIILNSDCHYSNRMTSGYDKAIEIIKKAGFKEMQVLGVNSLFETTKID